MDRLNKELILNLTIVSFVMSLLLAWLGANIDINSSPLRNRDDWTFSFMFLLFILYFSI